jgi:hypothetical protein
MEWRCNSYALFYSVRKASTGSMEAARRAGMRAAMQAAKARVTTAKLMMAALALVIS